MAEQRIVPITALGLAEDGKIHISQTTNDLYIIEQSADIVIEDGVSASILDTAKQSKISIVVSRDAKAEYIVLDSADSQRELAVWGEIQMTEIVLHRTEESLRISLEKENSLADVKCLCALSGAGGRFIQNIIHQRPQTFSNISNVAVAMNHSEIEFSTTGKIEKGMSGSNCRQLSRGIVMDDSSAVTAKPILLIDEYDCFAKHGASIGKMSDEDLFYLMSRGLNKKEAFLLILQGIIQPFMASVPAKWKDRIEEEVSNLIEK